MLKRTVTCGELRKEQTGRAVVLNGWVNRRRDLGGLIFVDLRDRYGVTQVVFDPEDNKELFAKAHKLGAEDVIGVKGVVRARPGDAANRDLPTGEIEVLARAIEIFNSSKTLPFLVTDRSTGLEDLRLKYRYLELRTKELQHNIALRHKAAQSVRKYFNSNDFFEIETPFLMKSTPEGARDYLVPSRIHKGRFYALPQSPQTYKQLLMISGFDRYFQIVKCFRDEDLRADRQPEFTQIDVEMSFVEEDDIMTHTESMLKQVFKEVIDVDLDSAFPRMSYEEALLKYGSDKPDLRFGMPIQTLNSLAARTAFKVFQNVIESDGTVAGICVPGGAHFSRKIIDELTTKVQGWGAKGLAFAKVTENGLESGIAKFLNNVEKDLIGNFEANAGDILLFVADKKNICYPALGNLRLAVAKQLNLIPANIYKPLWVTRFPLVEWSEEDQRYIAVHHPFTSAVPEERDLMKTQPEKVHARAYDIVINGQEIGGGSIRNHTPEMQSEMFDILGIDKAEAENKFGFLLDALAFGAPPHGGIALGFDRLVSILVGVDNIREVIAFPKTTSAASLMDGSPTAVSGSQLKELGIKIC
ncbi:MAG TPA: aspartate--tRNA ligase [Candidatus Marinimicrobia bacterium]|nr:aspartate--tRNA ligase [Candidatus Neomarinimicrobiota bacterium]